MIVAATPPISIHSSSGSKALSELKNIIQNNKIPNALLFTGKDNSFLIRSAENFAKAINCLHPLQKSFFKIPCNQCNSCKKIIADMHPDIIRIVPDNHIIKIAAIRDLFRFTISKPNEAAMRVIIIENADTMNEQAQNAFLKMLEEPPVNTFFILIAENINSLLATIVSRCRNIWLNPVDIKNKEHIAENADNDVEWVNRKNWIIKEIISIIDTEKQQNRFNKLKPLLFAEKLSREPDILKKSLGVISTFFRDLAVCHYNPDKINNTNYTQTLINISNKISLKKTLYFFSTLYEAERKNHFNPSSIRLNLECLFLKISSGEK